MGDHGSRAREDVGLRDKAVDACIRGDRRQRLRVEVRADCDEDLAVDRGERVEQVAEPLETAEGHRPQRRVDEGRPRVVLAAGVGDADRLDARAGRRGLRLQRGGADVEVRPAIGTEQRVRLDARAFPQRRHVRERMPEHVQRCARAEAVVVRRNPARRGDDRRRELARFVDDRVGMPFVRDGVEVVEPCRCFQSREARGEHQLPPPGDGNRVELERRLARRELPVELGGREPDAEGGESLGLEARPVFGAGRERHLVAGAGDGARQWQHGQDVAVAGRRREEDSHPRRSSRLDSQHGSPLVGDAPGPEPEARELRLPVLRRDVARDERTCVDRPGRRRVQAPSCTHGLRSRCQKAR